MVSDSKQRSKIVGIGGSLLLLAAVGYADYISGYEFTLLAFYFLPILFALRNVGPAFAYLMASMASFVWLWADVADGQHYTDFLVPIWNTSIRMSVFLLVVLLFTARSQLKKLVDQKTESLREEIRERTRLEKELLEIAESEQRRIGHDLHDSLGQHLTATAMAGKILAKKLANKSAVEPATAEHVVAMVEEAIDLTRKLARTLHPIELGVSGLEDALQNLAANMSRAFSVSCRFQHSGTVMLDDPQAGIHLYRIAQEAVSNSIRHGRARDIVISLEAAGENILLSVTDDGGGLAAGARVKKGMGLRIMDYRAGMIGATFDIQNLPAGGTRAVCVLNSNQADKEEYADEK
ncbi:MAG TPA: sensor histidine kinase [Verrucomicrobiae bacterium]|nr:sensor histidine kinase [Verrucomicrobiae bacterium]